MIYTGESLSKEIDLVKIYDVLKQEALDKSNIIKANKLDETLKRVKAQSCGVQTVNYINAEEFLTRL